MQHPSPIGIFDSGYGGLTVFRKIAATLPQFDYIYLGDNARTPYGTRSFETVYHYTLQAVEWFFKHGCHLVILACNTASAKALRSIQQFDLPRLGSDKRVLGVIRPTAEIIGKHTTANHVGILATKGTVMSGSYPIEIGKHFPSIQVHQQACPLWVPLIENNEHDSPGAGYFIEKYVNELLTVNANIDAILLACTHYPLIKEHIRRLLPPNVSLLSQGDIVADSLRDYLARHPTLAEQITTNGSQEFYTTDDPQCFDRHATRFFGRTIQSKQACLVES